MSEVKESVVVVVGLLGELSKLGSGEKLLIVSLALLSFTVFEVALILGEAFVRYRSITVNDQTNDRM